MSNIMKRIFLCLIGLISGLAVWPVAEFLIFTQSKFGSYFIFNICTGLIFGLILGGFYSSSEGIILADRSKIRSGIIMGAIVGLIGGVIGFLAGQFMLFFLGETLIHSMEQFEKVGLPLSRSIGWALLGVFIGMTEGIRARSFKKIRVGFIGGLIGGAIGGLSFEYIKLFMENQILSRLMGLFIFGFFIGLFYGFVEKSLSYGIIRLLNGRYKGKEFLINQRKMKIGSSPKADIQLNDYESIADIHSVIYIKKGEVYIRNEAAKVPTTVNDDKITDHILRLEDVIKVGSAKFIFKYT